MEKGCVTVVGLGKLGACLAACLADKGYSVVGVDLSPEVVQLVNEGKAPVVEPGLDAMIQKNHTRLKATGDMTASVRDSSVTFIVVPTPSEPDGTFSVRYVRDAAHAIGAALREKRDYHLVVLVSTVLPGGTEEGLISVLGKVSGKRCSTDFGVCYNPEFIALGNVIYGMLHPELVLIGESDTKAGAQLEALYGKFIESPAPFVRTNFANAELAKISINTYVTMKITFANMLAQLCQGLPGGDVDVVTRALGTDTRIGSRYLKGGLGFGGPCFPRDTVAFSVFARKLGVAAGLAEATQVYNSSVAGRVVDMARQHLAPNAVVAVLGMAYKPDTPVVEESQGLEIARRLASAGANVRIYDPLALDTARQVLGDQVQYARTLAESLDGVDAVVVANPLPELKAVPALLDHNSSKRVTVLDCWRILPELAGNGRIRYVAMGRGPTGERS